MATDTARLLPDTPAEFRAWLETRSDDEELFGGPSILLRFLKARTDTPVIIGYSEYFVDTQGRCLIYPMPDWATDVVHTVDSGFYPTVGDLKRHIDGERPRFLEGVE